MVPLHRLVAAGGLALLLALGSAGCTASAPVAGAPAAAPASTAPAGALPTSALPAVSLAPTDTAPPAPAHLAEPVAAGTVARQPGPFDDRLRMTGVRLRAGTVEARLRVTSDVSEVLALEVDADFYDARGALLGRTRTRSAPAHEAAGVPDEAVALRLPAATAYRHRVASAVLSVPVLVNE